MRGKGGRRYSRFRSARACAPKGVAWKRGRQRTRLDWHAIRQVERGTCAVGALKFLIYGALNERRLFPSFNNSLFLASPWAIAIPKCGWVAIFSILSTSTEDDAGAQSWCIIHPKNRVHERLIKILWGSHVHVILRVVNTLINSLNVYSKIVRSILKYAIQRVEDIN